MKKIGILFGQEHSFPPAFVERVNRKTGGKNIAAVSAPSRGGSWLAITSPSAGSALVAPLNIAIEAVATDSDGTVARVDFYVNGALVGWSATAPYSVRWSVKSAGTYVLTAIATDDRGGQKPSAQVVLTLKKKGNSRK